VLNDPRIAQYFGDLLLYYTNIKTITKSPLHTNIYLELKQFSFIFLSTCSGRYINEITFSKEYRIQILKKQKKKEKVLIPHLFLSVSYSSYQT
jgi:hypothetical protein